MITYIKNFYRKYISPKKYIFKECGCSYKVRNDDDGYTRTAVKQDNCKNESCKYNYLGFEVLIIQTNKK